MNLGPWELVLIGLVAVLLFGGGRIAGLGKGLGEGIRNFKSGLKEGAEDDEASKAPVAKEAPVDKKV
jgi:sec-independent protein translocase protein TatA